MNLEKAKKALIEFQKKHESYLDAAKQYREYKSLPFWKKWFVDEVKSPKDYCYDVCTICCTSSMAIELRMYFSGVHKEITLAINEKGNGYRLNIDTKEKTYYLGSINPDVSLGAELILEDIRRELAPLYIV